MTTRLFDVHAVGASFDVCAVGNAIVDIIATADDAFLAVHEIQKGGMTLIEETRANFLYDRLGQTIQMSGGSAANTAAGIASLGGTPAYIGKVKEDLLGKIFRHDLRGLGVRFVTRSLDDGAATGRCIVIVTPDAQRSMNTFLGAATEISPADIDPEIVKAAQVTYLEGYLFDKPSAQESFHTAASMAHAADRQVALSLSDTFCAERHRDAFRNLIKGKIDILIANEKEIMALYGVNSFEEAIKAATADCSFVVGTRSAKGAVVMHKGEVTEIPAERVEKVLDTTGAGDLFAAGFLYGVTHGFDMATAGRIGAIAAAEIISHFGPRPQRSLRELVATKGLRI